MVRQEDLLNTYKICILSATGSLLYEAWMNQPEHYIDIKQLGESGVYYIRILDENLKEVATKAVVLQ